jgi:hypothetical protein
MAATNKQEEPAERLKVTSSLPSIVTPATKQSELLDVPEHKEQSHPIPVSCPGSIDPECTVEITSYHLRYRRGHSRIKIKIKGL